MSRHDEFHDLKEQLRQQRPTTEPMPPAYKRRLRAQLVERKMNEGTGFVLSPLRLAMGALVLLLAPALFFLWQMGLLRDVQNPAVSAPVELEPAASTIDEPPAVSQAADWVEVIGSYPQPQTVLSGERPTVSVMVAYELFTADEAELIVRLNQAVDEQSGRGVVSASQVITRGQGVAAMPLTIDASEAVEGPLSLNVLMRDTSADTERLLYLDFPVDFVWPYDPAEDESLAGQANAVILGSGQPQPSENGRLVPDVNGYQVEVYVAYELGEYSQGYASLGYEYEGLRGSSSGTTTQWVSGEESITKFILGLEPEFFYDDGSFRDEVVFTLELMGMDEVRGENVTIFPDEAVQAQLEIREHLDILSVILTEDAMGLPALEVGLWYERRLAAESTISLTAEAGADVLEAVTIPVNRQRDSVTAILPVDLTAYPGDFLLRIAAVLDTGNETLLAEYPLQVGSLLSERMNEVWLLSTEWISATDRLEASPGQMKIVAGYALSDEYPYGVLSVNVEQQSTGTGGGGGGSGGGSHIVEPGTGSIGFGVPAVRQFKLGPDGAWPVGLSLTLEMRGVSDDGTETVLSVWRMPEQP